MGVFREMFAWWTGNTIGTRMQCWLNGQLIGEDEFGNSYYEQRKGVGPLGKPRRWVVYDELAEASKVPPDWHGWLHYTVDTPPNATDYKPRAWQRPHRPNPTGSPHAYRPDGSILTGDGGANSAGDYRAWRPE